MRTYPSLRSDLVIKKQTVSKQDIFIVKDPVKQTYYRFEKEEYFVLNQLDGSKKADELANLYNDEFQEDLDANDIVEFISTVNNYGIFERTNIEQNIYLYEQLIEKRKSLIRQAQGSALYFRIPVIDPNAFFDKIFPYIRWLWSPLAVNLMIIFILSAVAVLINQHKAVQTGMAHMFDFFNQNISSLLVLWTTVMIVIAIHELGHGLTCRRFGGECHEIGFLFMFFTPCMYANVNDAWMFENKRYRLYVAFAGCYFEFVVGSIAVFLWLFSQQGSMVHILSFKVVVVCFFSAIFMNFNPLMKFDGYFALSDYVEIPNLRTLSREYVIYLIQTKIFRMQKDFEVITKREQRILFIYGILSSLYMMNVIIGLIFLLGGTLIQYFHGAGVLITILIVYKFFGYPVRKLFNFLRQVMTEHQEKLNRKSVLFLLLTLVLTVFVIFSFYPFAQYFETPATLESVRK